MNYKIRKILFLLTRNCRTNLKVIGKELKISQQAVSYQINKLEKEKNITYFTLTDHIKLGFINIFVGMNFKSYTKENQRKILSQLRAQETIVSVFKGESGIDILFEIQARNLSHFNKTFSQFIEINSKIIDTKFIQPMIVKHTYPRNYLIKKNEYEDIVTLGDRDYQAISDDDEKVLRQFEKKPRITLMELSKQTKLGVKKVLSIKKNLEKKAIIRKYSCHFNHKKMGISKKILLLKSKEEFITNIDTLVEFAKIHPNIIELTKLIGKYNIMIITESLQSENILEEIREKFPINEHIVITVEKQL